MHPLRPHWTLKTGADFFVPAGQWCQRHRADVWVGLALAALMAVSVNVRYKRLDPSIYINRNRLVHSVWFEADSPHYYHTMVYGARGTYRPLTSVHPMLPLLMAPPARFLDRVPGLSRREAVRLVILGTAVLWVVGLFALLRLIGCGRAVAALYTLLGMVSAASVFWFALPESYGFGSVGIMAALLTVAVASRRAVSLGWYALLTAVNFGITVTNAMAGVIAAAVTVPRRRWLWFVAFVLIGIAALWGVQKAVFPNSRLPLQDSKKAQFIYHPDRERLWQVASGFVSHAMVMPAIREVDRYKRPHWPILITQESAPGFGTPWGLPAVGLWLALLGLGLAGFCRVREHRPMRLAVALLLAGQGALHVVYGEETFLYALHWMPLLVLLAAFSARPPARGAAIGLALLLILCAGVNNAIQFERAARLVDGYAAKAKAAVPQPEPEELPPAPNGQ